LTLDARDVFFAQRAEQIALLALVRFQRRRIVEGVNETQIRIVLILARDRGIGRLDVQVRDIVGQDRNFIGVQFFEIFVPQLCGLTAKMLDQFGDKGAGARCGIKDFDIFVDSALPKCLWQRKSALSIIKRTISFGV